MRFKTRLRPERVAQLIKVCHVIERVDRQCVLHLCSFDDEFVRLVVCTETAALGSLSVYTSLKRADWFESYRIESHNHNQIGLQLDVRNLSRALRSASAADTVVIKLTKKAVPILSFEIGTILGPIKQEIPVMVLSAARLAEFHEPNYAHTKGVALPSLFKLHAMIDRMKCLSTTACIDVDFGSAARGNRNEEEDEEDEDRHRGRRDESHQNENERKCKLLFKVSTDMVTVSTTYASLSTASYDPVESTDSQPVEPSLQRHANQTSRIQAHVDIRNLSKCLHGYHAQPTHALCFIHATCVMLHLMLPFDVTMSYFIPRRTMPL